MEEEQEQKQNFSNNFVDDSNRRLHYLSDLVLKSYNETIDEVKQLEEVTSLKGISQIKDADLINPEYSF
jgi:hypothetical protein